MKKIAIVTQKMVMGGIEKALIAMLEELSEYNLDITVFTIEDGGELEESIPKYISKKRVYGEGININKRILYCLKNKEYKNAMRIINGIIINKTSKKHSYIKWSKLLPINKEVYDLAISYGTPASFSVIYTVNNLISKKKIAWIHADVSKYIIPENPYKEFYHKFNKIFCVSQEGLKKFNNRFPKLINRTEVFYNIVKKEKIISLAKEEVFNSTSLKIVTVGRLSKEKGQSIIPLILKKLLKDGYDIKWYCIGDGPLKDELEVEINENELKDRLILLGNINNPYPYMYGANIYVQTSLQEGYCIALKEARILYRPIITTKFVGAQE